MITGSRGHAFHAGIGKHGFLIRKIGERMDFQSLLNNNATIIVAVLGAVVSVFTLVLGKRYETKIELRKIKEN